MGAHFLCCLPLRLGVLVISIIQFLLLGIGAGFIWAGYWYLSRHAVEELTTRVKIWLICYGIFCTIGSIMALVGFIGVLRKKLSYISHFASMQWAYFFALLITSIVHTVLIFTQPADRLLDSCLQRADSDSDKDSCHKFFDNWKKPATIAIYFVLLSIPILVQLYGAYITGAYAKKLQKEGNDRNMILTASGGFKYEAAGMHDDSRPLTQPDVVYPYKDGPHSFGNKAHV